MISDTQSITIKTNPDSLFDFISNPHNLPQWAPALCDSVTEQNGEFLLQTSFAPVKLQYKSNKQFGVIDLVLSPALPIPIKITAHTRIIPGSNESLFIFTHFQLPLLGEETFRKQKEKVTRGLAKLKEIIESQPNRNN